MTNKYDKPFISYEKMAEILRNRNLHIESDELAQHLFDVFSYYTLVNGYKSALISPESKDQFLDGADIYDLYYLHMADSDLGNLLLKYIIHIETTFKSRMSYLVSSSFGVMSDYSSNVHNNPDDYLNRKHYSKRSPSRNNTIDHLTEILNPARRSGYKSSSLMHYAANHNHIPPWVLVTSMTLGETTKWYEILKPNDKLQISGKFISSHKLTDEEKKELFLISMKQLRAFRNTIAHGSPLYSFISKHQVPRNAIIELSGGIVSGKEYNISPYAKSGLHAVIGIIPCLLGDDRLRYQFYNDFLSFCNLYKDARIINRTILNTFNLPNDIYMRIESNKKTLGIDLRENHHVETV